MFSPSVATEYTNMSPAANEPDAVGFGSRLVEKLLVDKFARHPKTSVIQGWGHKWLPA